MEQLKVFSMFDGVGGFIHGLHNADNKLFNVVYSNQFEPSRKVQDAFEVGQYYFGDSMIHDNRDVTTLEDEDFQKIKALGTNMIVGGFPCQDYSVARSKKHEKGIEGKKGVLFWSIIQATKIIEPKYLVLENVDRLLKSPSKQRGRDFAIMLAAFNKLGYSVEWRVINAADYGRAQRRRRVFFFVYKNNTQWAQEIDKKFEKDGLQSPSTMETPILDEHIYDDYLFQSGLFARQFPVEQQIKFDGRRPRQYSAWLGEDTNWDDYVLNVSENFTGTIWNTGIMRHGRYFTIDTTPIQEQPITLGEIVAQAKNFYVNQYGEIAYQKYVESFWITDVEKQKKYEYLRGAKKIERTTPDGHSWIYSEGGMAPYDSLDLPARTMLTSEGSVNRSTHYLFENNHYRLLTPIEAELLQDFPEDSTRWKLDSNGHKIEVSDRMRYFFMGNALVTGIVTRIGKELAKITD